MVDDTNFSGLIEMIFNRFLVIVVPIIPLVFFEFEVDKGIFQNLISNMAVIVVFIALGTLSTWFNLRLKYLSFAGGSFRLGYVKRISVESFNVGTFIRGNVSYLGFSYILDGKRRKGFTILRLFRAKKIYSDICSRANQIAAVD